MECGATATNRPPLARLETRRRLSFAGGRRRHSDHSAHARTREHSANAALSERDRRRTAQRLGGELEQSGPTASTGVGDMNRPRFVAKLSPFCPRRLEKMAPQAGFEPATLRLTEATPKIDQVRPSAMK